jgi:hypothetical protein
VIAFQMCVRVTFVASGACTCVWTGDIFAVVVLGGSCRARAGGETDVAAYGLKHFTSMTARTHQSSGFTFSQTTSL